MTIYSGTSGADSLSGATGDDSLYGMEGNDTLSGGGGNDVISGGAGDDVVEGGAGADTLSGGDEPDTLPAASTALAMGHGDLSGWSNVNASATYDAGLDAYGIHETSATNSHYIHTTVTGLTTGVAQTYSIVVKAGARSELFLQAITEAGDPDEHYNFIFDLTDGSYEAFTQTYTWASGVTAGTRDLGDGWYQIWISATPATTDGDLWMTIRGIDNGNLSYTGSTSSPAYYVRDFQLEQNVTEPTAITVQAVDDLDMLSYASSSAAVSVDLDSGAVSGGDAEGDVIDGFTGVIGSAHDDTLAGDFAANVLSGGAGNDLLYGRDGADTLVGGDGADTFRGVASDLDGDTVADYASGDVLHLTNVPSTRLVEASVDAGVTTITVFEADGTTVATTFALDGNYYTPSLVSDGSSGSYLTMIEGVIGTSGGDVLSGTMGADALVGGDGADSLYGGGGNDVLYGDGGDDVVEGGAGADTLYGGDEPGALPANSTILAMGKGDLTGWSTLNASASYDSSLDAYGISETSASGPHYINATVTGLTTGQVQTYSAVVKAGARSEILLQAITDLNDPNQHHNFIFDLTDGSYEAYTQTYTFAQGVAAGSRDLGNGWYQIWVSSPSSVTDGDLWISLRGVGGDPLGYTGSPGSPIFYARDIQIEQGVTEPTAITLLPVDDLDVLSYASSSAAVSVDLDSGVVSGGDAQGDVIDGFTGIIGSAHNDALAGDSAANLLSGGAGNDLLYGRDGADTLVGGDGDDTFRGSASELDGDTITDYGSGDLLHLTDVPSTRSVEASVDDGVTTVTVYEADGTTVASTFTVDGNYYAPSLASDGSGGSYLALLAGTTGTAGGDVLSGTAGAEALAGGDGADTLYGGAGNDALYGDAGDDVLEGGAGADTLSGGDEPGDLPANSTALAMGKGSLTGWSTVNASASYDSGLDAYGITETSATGAHYINTTVTGLTSGQVQTYSAVVKAGARSEILLQGITELTDQNLHHNFIFDLTDGSYEAYTQTYTWASGVSGGSRDLGNGWYQIWVSSPASVTDGDLWISLRGVGDDPLGYTGSPGSPIFYARDIQIEQGVTEPTAISLLPVDDLDLLSYASSSAAVSVNLDSGAVSGGDAEGDVIDGFTGVIGSTHDDTLAGDFATNVLSGGAGNDLLSGGDGVDTLVGGDGDDTLVGGAGADVLSGGTGSDTVDYLGSGSAVTVNLSTGSGSSGDAFSGVENVIGSGSGDALTGDNGANGLYGADGADVLAGGGGADTLSGGSGADTLSGGDGDDTLVAGDGADAVFGGSGTDTVDYSGSGSAVGVDLSTGIGSGGDAAGDAFSGVENVIGSGSGDTLTGDGGANALYGADGADILAGDGGADTLAGGDGDDTLVGGAGADAIDGGTGTDTLDYSGSGSAVGVDLSTGTGSGGDAAGDTVSGVENVVGSGSGDTLTGDSSANVIHGGDGADAVAGGGGGDTLWGGAGDDVLTGGSGVDVFVFSAGDGEDTLLDFDYTTEMIDLQGGLGFIDNADLADNLASDGTGGSVITFDTGEVLRLVGVDPSNVDVSLFV